MSASNERFERTSWTIPHKRFVSTRKLLIEPAFDEWIRFQFLVIDFDFFWYSYGTRLWNF